MLSYKMDFSSCDIMSGFGKSNHILSCVARLIFEQECGQQDYLSIIDFKELILTVILSLQVFLLI